MHHKLGQFNEAKENYTKLLLEQGFSSHTENSIQPEQITTVYNLARLYEDMHDFANAEALYHALSKQHPAYIDGEKSIFSFLLPSLFLFSLSLFLLKNNKILITIYIKKKHNK
jgi:hypothetical protein